jgi:photosystem II stability/assembly factor-like uncharacterized protein
MIGAGGTSAPRRRATRLAALVVVALVPLLLLVTAGGAAATVSAKLASTPVEPPVHRMAGQVQVLTAAFPTAEHGVVLISQCKPCGSQGGPTHEWVAVTDDAGRSWTVRRTPQIPAYYYPGIVFANARDGWALGDYVTHDGGLTWRQAHIPDHVFPVDSVSIAGGRVWALAEPDGPVYKTVVLTGSAAGDTLVRTRTQQDAVGWSIVAGSATAAYVNVSSYRPPPTATDDGGRSWHNVSAGCPPGHAVTYGLLGAKGADLLQVCRADRLYHGVPKIDPKNQTELISRSTDGGLHWRTTPNPSFVIDPRPVSATVAWAMCDFRNVCRSTDGGATWTTVWKQPARPLDSFPAAFAAPGPLEAEVIADVSSPRGTYLVVYATTDGGLRWQSTVVPLPTG